MLIICPKCFAKYNVDDELIHQNEQIFQCSACHHRFVEHLKTTNENVVSSKQATVSHDEKTSIQSVEPQPQPQHVAIEPISVLPEAFTPVTDMVDKKQKHVMPWIILILLFGIICGGLGAWVYRDELMDRYPMLKKAIRLLVYSPQQANQAAMEDIILLSGAQVLQTQADEKPVLDVIVPPQQIPAILQNHHPEQQNASDIQIQNEVSSDMPISESVAAENIDTQAVYQDDENKVENTEENPVVSDVVDDVIVEDVMVNDMPIVESPVSQEMPQPALSPAVVPMPAEVPVAVQTIADVVIRDVTFVYDQDNPRLIRLFVQGVVENAGAYAGLIPPLQAQLFDKDNVLLGVRDLPYAQTLMKPKTAEFFFYELNEVPKGTVARIHITVKGK